MSKKLFVGGLKWETDDHGLREAFAEYGHVAKADVVTDRDSGRSRGFGFVTFETEEDASAAMESMNGATLDGRTIRVEQAHEKKPYRTSRYDDRW